MTVEPSADLNHEAEVRLPWSRTDSLLLGLLAAAALGTRFWRLGYPKDPVFDEIQFVGQGVAYLRGEQFICVHPSLPDLIMASFIKLLGQHSWVWRSPGAVLGAALVVVTFLLGREMFRSRLAAALGALFVLCDGMFLIHSRLGMLEIYHVTFTAASYLFLFQFLRTSNPSLARRRLLYLGLVSGAALASKLMIPEVGFLLVTGFMVKDLVARNQNAPGQRNRRIIGALVLLGSASSLVYLAAFMPNYWLGWWGGAWSLAHYYHEVIWQLGEFAEQTNPFVSPWWSWPLMLRAPLYWQTNLAGQIATIWEGGNPVLWWSSLGALAITLVKGFRFPTTSRSFLLIGWASYMLALALSKHPFYLYIYMPLLYLQYLMLADLLAECWNGESAVWEQVVLVLSLAPAVLLAFGTTAGTVCTVSIAVLYAMLAWRFTVPGRFVCVLLVAAGLLAFVYFLPLWLGIPLESAGYEVRIWLPGPGLIKWM